MRFKAQKVMAVQILILIAGLLLVVKGADFLVDGATSIARKAGISEFVIGLTIVGFGTSCPELVVSLTGAFAGNSDISIGNVVGSNICNTLLILGLTALISPIVITSSNKKRDIPVTVAATLLLILLGMKHSLFGWGVYDGLSRGEAAIFLLLMAAYLFMCFRYDDGTDNDDIPQKTLTLPIALLLTAGGLAGLIAGGQMFVNSATAIAKSLGVSDKFIAITILAVGTSLPELATCVVAAAKHKGQMALGNILGSNVFNILLILGCAGVVCPLDFRGMNLVDMGVMLAGVLVVLIGAFTWKRNLLDRVEASVLLLLEIGYLTWLFMTI